MYNVPLAIMNHLVLPGFEWVTSRDQHNLALDVPAEGFFKSTCQDVNWSTGFRSNHATLNNENQ